MRALAVSSTGTLRSTNVDSLSQATIAFNVLISSRATNSYFSSAALSTYPRVMNIFLSKSSAEPLRKPSYIFLALESFRFEKTFICVFS